MSFIKCWKLQISTDQYLPQFVAAFTKPPTESLLSDWEKLTEGTKFDIVKRFQETDCWMTLHDGEGRLTSRAMRGNLADLDDFQYQEIELSEAPEALQEFVKGRR